MGWRMARRGAATATGKAVPGWALLAVAHWPLLALLVVAVDPDQLGRPLALLLLALPLTGCLASPPLLWLAWRGAARPWRGGGAAYLAAAALCGALLLRAAQALTPPRLILLGLLLALAALVAPRRARQAPPSPARSAAGGAKPQPPMRGDAAKRGAAARPVRRVGRAG